jgi:hypothetical protein
VEITPHSIHLISYNLAILVATIMLLELYLLCFYLDLSVRVEEEEEGELLVSREGKSPSGPPWERSPGAPYKGEPRGQILFPTIGI